MLQYLAQKLRNVANFGRKRASDVSRLFRAETYGLRARLIALILTLLSLSMLVPGALLFMQHKVSRDAARIATNASERMILEFEAREVLRSLKKSALRGISDPSELTYLRDLALHHGGEAGDALLGYTKILFQKLQNDKSVSDQEILVSHLRASEILESDINADQARVLEASREQQERQLRIFRAGILALVAAAALFMFLGYKITSLVTRPVQTLIGFLDRVDLEDGLPGAMLVSESKMPEVSRLAAAFDRFVDRIRGYRALNIRRLIVEKHRADLIAKSILDGIFLLRGDELIYANPVGEKILGICGISRKKVKLSAFLDKMDDQTLAALGIGGANVSALRAVQLAITRTLPVEFSLRAEDRSFHYLLQARPVLEPTLAGEEELLAEEFGELSTVEPQSGIAENLGATMIVVAQDVTLVRESQEAKGHFLATLSHEIKTPVTSLTMATRLLRKSVDQVPNPSHRSLIVTCAEDVDRLRGLLGDLLSISSFDTLTQRLEIQSVDLGRLIKQSVQSFKPQARERGIDLSCEVILSQGKPIIAPMDPTKIAWAVSNLLTNGLRHTPRGGTVSMSLQVVDGKAEVRVRDTGPGIDRKRQAQIFEKFNSHYDIRVGRSGSAGVGLAIAREIVVAHQGRIWVASEPGKGAEFGFTLPLGRRPGGLTGDLGGNIGGAGGGISGGTIGDDHDAKSSLFKCHSGASASAGAVHDVSRKDDCRKSINGRTKGAMSGAPAGC